MVTPHYSKQIRSGLSRIWNVVSVSEYADPAVSSCLDDMARSFSACFRASERCVQELKREVRRK